MTDSGFSWGGTDGMVLGGVFWSDVSKESPIDELLGKLRAGEDIPLERFLDEQTILQEVAASNTDLINFLVEHLGEMIDYITLGRKRKETFADTQHPHTNEHYAYISCEILSINSNTLTNALLKNDANLERLFQILLEPAPLSPRSTGYFHMILLMLCQKDANTMLLFVSKETALPIVTPKTEVPFDPFSEQTERLTLTAVAASSLSASSTGSEKDTGERQTKRPIEQDEREEMNAKRAPVLADPFSEISEHLTHARKQGSEASFARDDTEVTWEKSSSPVSKMSSMGMVPLFLNHVDSYSIACAFMVLLQAAANQLENTQDSTASKAIFTFHDSTTNPKVESPELLRARRLWTGGYGTAAAVLAALRERSDPYSHSNAADLLIELFRRAASAKKSYLESKQLASLHVTDDEQQAPFAMNDEDFKDANEITPLGLLHSVSTSSGDDNWTLSLVDELCGLIVNAKELSSATDSATRVLSAMVTAYSQPFSGNDSVVTKQESCPEIERILRQLSNLVALLSPPGGEKVFLNTQWGGRVARLGMGRLLLVELISSLITCGFKSVAQEMAYMERDPIKALLDLFFEFEWNNVLHSIVERTIKAILLGQTNAVRTIANLPSKDAQEQVINNQKAERERVATVEALLPLQKSLFATSPNLIERILDAYDSNAAAIRVVEDRYVQTSQGTGTTIADEKPRHGQKGYMGHLRNVANACAELIEAQNERGGPAFDALGESADLKQRWYDFVNGKLAETNQIVSKPLGGAPVKREPIGMNGFDQAGSGSLAHALGGMGEDLFKGNKSALSLEEDNLEDDEDDDEEDDPDVMARYNQRREEMAAQMKANATSSVNDSSRSRTTIVASSPQDSSWVVDEDDFATEFPEPAGVVFGSPSGYDGTFFNPLNVSDAVSSPEKKDQRREDDVDDFDPFGTEKKVVSASVPIKKPAVPSTPADDFGGVTPPGFEVIDKM